MNETLKEYLRKVQELQFLNIADVFNIDMSATSFQVYVVIGSPNRESKLILTFSDANNDKCYERRYNAIKALLDAC